jgi:hypothetical protein
MDEPEIQFRAAYKKLAAREDCDPLDSEEYTRILSEWLFLGSPQPVAMFIFLRANERNEEDSMAPLP